MKKIFPLLILAIFALTGCPSANSPSVGNQTSVMPGNNTNTSANTMNTNTMLKSDAGEFMTKAAQGGMAEVKLGETAASKAQNADVKAFGKKMVEDHGKANAELKELAAKKGVTLPTEPNEKQKETAEKLSKLSGAEFDKEYVAEMVKDHEKDVAMFEEEAKNAADADVKAFADKTLPTLKTHLEMIKGIQAKMK